MSMQTTSDNSSGEPMLDINVTPLIDVMLVLLIMLIITIPPQTHAVKLDLPVNQPNQPPPPIQPVKNTVGVTAQGAITWNGSPISKQQLRQYLEVTQQMNPIPELHLQPDATARYELVDEVLAITKKAHVQKMGFVGNNITRRASSRSSLDACPSKGGSHPEPPFLFASSRMQRSRPDHCEHWIASSLALLAMTCHCSRR